MPWPIILRIKSAPFNSWFILVHWLCFLSLQYLQTMPFFHRCTLLMDYALLILWWYLKFFVLNGSFITKTAARLKLVEEQMHWLLRISKKPQMNLIFCNVLLTFSKNLRSNPKSTKFFECYGTDNWKKKLNFCFLSCFSFFLLLLF